jgi:hypothetical protein
VKRRILWYEGVVIMHTRRLLPQVGICGLVLTNSRREEVASASVEHPWVTKDCRRDKVLHTASFTMVKNTHTSTDIDGNAVTPLTPKT